MAKFGKKIEIQLNPLDYNLALIGESGIGKSTLAKAVCEKLAGKDGYLAFDMGKESGHNAIQGIVSETCEDWDKFEEVVEDIVDNKSSDYPDLKVVIIDTIDQLFDIVEPEVVRLHNLANPDKRTDTINSAFGGFGKGLDKAIELVLNKLWDLKRVGVSFFIIGHTKRREVEDVVTGQSYSTLTTNIQQRYFNAIKTKLDVLGVASIDREIVQQKTGKKNAITKKDETRNIIASETRKITFRDDNYTIDSKSRFANIVESITMDSDDFIKAIKDAILAEHKKGEKTVEESKEEQEKKEVEKLKKIAKAEEDKAKQKELKPVIEKITSYIKDNRSDMNKVKPLIAKSKELGFDNPTQVDNMKDAEEIANLMV